MTTKTTPVRKQFVICIRNEGYAASLEPRKIYQVIPNAHAEKHKLLSVVDESGEAYLYPRDYFAPVRLSATVVRALSLAA